MFKKLLDQANTEVKKVIDYITENKEMFSYMDLKLHDASYYTYAKMKDDFPLCFENDTNDEYSYFYLFCEDNYNMFIEDLKEAYNIDFKNMCVSLGRTSSFYLQNFVEWSNGEINIENTLDNLFYIFYYNIPYNLIYTNSIIYIGEDCNKEEEIKDCLEYLCNNFYNDFMEHIKDIKIVYDYITSFKENQIEYFKEYLTYQEEQLQEEKEEQEKLLKERNDKILIIKEKYNISDDDMLVLMEG